MPETVADVVTRALDALGGLRELGEDVADEWQYVSSLDAAWRERLEAVRTARTDELVTPDVAAAIDRAADEAALITDPHRAIDWLSTLPQVVLLALDEPG